jgi:hypothetical protein
MSDKPRKKPSKRVYVNDEDVRIILDATRKCRDMVEPLEESSFKKFVVLHYDRIITRLEKRLKERGGGSKIRAAMSTETTEE